MGLLRRLFRMIQSSSKMDDSSSLPKHILNVLNKAFDAYVQAYSSKQMRYLVPYFDRPCIQCVAPSIYNEDRFFATSRFRRVTWELSSKKGDILTVVQSIEFDKIRAAGFTISVSQAYKEVWTLNTKNNLVESVMR